MDVGQQHGARVPGREIAEVGVDAVHGIPLLLLGRHAGAVGQKATVRPRMEIARIQRQQPACTHSMTCMLPTLFGVLSRVVTNHLAEQAHARAMPPGHWGEAAWHAGRMRLTL